MNRTYKVTYSIDHLDNNPTIKIFDEWYEDSEGTKLPIDTPTRQGDSQDPTIENNIEGLGGNIVVPDGFEKKSLYSIRIGELLAFIAAYNEQRFTSIESRLTALEST